MTIQINTEGVVRLVHITQNPAAVVPPGVLHDEGAELGGHPDADSLEESGSGALESPPPSEQPESGAA